MASRSTAPLRPVARSSDTPEERTTAGTSACLAPSLGPRSSPASATRPRDDRQGQQVERVQQGDRADDDHAEQVGEHRDPAGAEPVDDRPAAALAST